MADVAVLCSSVLFRRCVLCLFAPCTARLPSVGETISADPKSGRVETGGKVSLHYALGPAAATPTCSLSHSPTHSYSGLTAIRLLPRVAVLSCVVCQGCNTAVCAARLSSSPSTVRFCCQLGDDSHRPMLLQSLQSAQLDTSLVHTVSGVSTGAAYILCLPGGHNSIVLLGGANHAWTLPLSAPLCGAIRSAGCVLLQREVPDAVNEAVARECGGHRKLLVDVGGSTAPLSPALLAATQFLAPNETELSGLTAMKTDTEQQIVAAAMHALRTTAVEYLLCTVGDRGCYLFPAPASPASTTTTSAQSSYAYLHCPAFPIDPVDSTGAGDTFRGAFAVAYNALRSSQVRNGDNSNQLQQLPLSALSSSLLFASAAAALCCLNKGTLTAMPDRQQVEQFMRQHTDIQAVEERVDSHSVADTPQLAVPGAPSASSTSSAAPLPAAASASSFPTPSSALQRSSARSVLSPHSSTDPFTSSFSPKPASSSASSLSSVSNGGALSPVSSPGLSSSSSSSAAPLLSPRLSSLTGGAVIPKRHRSLSTADMSDDRLHVIAQSFSLILQALGEDPFRAGLAATPMRAAKALAYFTKGYETDLHSIVNGAIFAENFNEMVIVKDIHIFSLCEHHLVPFTGKIHIGYIPRGKVLGSPLSQHTVHSRVAGRVSAYRTARRWD